MTHIGVETGPMDYIMVEAWREHVHCCVKDFGHVWKACIAGLRRRRISQPIYR